MKNKKASKSLSKSFFNSRGRIIGTCVVAAVIFVLVIVLMIVESSFGRWTIKNNTDYDLNFMKVSFSGVTFFDGLDTAGIETETIEANSKFTKKLETLNLFNTASNMNLNFKLENTEEINTTAGFFNSNFDGNITITFEPTEDPNLLTMKIKASNGIFKSTAVDCNEEYTIDISESAVY